MRQALCATWSVRRLIAPLVAEHGVRLAPPEGADGVAVQADPARLRQVLVNLCSNAVKCNRRSREMRLVVNTWSAAKADSRSDFVLYVENDPVNEPLMRTLIELRLGYGYAAAMTAQGGLLVARKHRPALVLVDLNLPDHDGLWLAAQVRGDAALQAVRRVAVTADATPETRAKLFASGFEDCWSKPLDMRAVAGRLHQLLVGEGRSSAAHRRHTSSAQALSFDGRPRRWVSSARPDRRPPRIDPG